MHFTDIVQGRNDGLASEGERREYLPLYLQTFVVWKHD